MAVKDQVIDDRYAIYNCDCVEMAASIPADSVGMSIYSPPFASESGGALYNYSSSDRDFSNARTYSEFFEQYEFLVREIYRMTQAGRITAVHCMDVPKAGANICGYSDFPGDIIRLHQKCGFEYLPRINIWKEPLAVRNRTMQKSLAHRQIVEDSTKTCVAASDYLIPFRKKGENKIPVTHPNGLLSYAGETPIPHELRNYKGWTGKQTENRYSHWIWRRYASSFWDDIRSTRVLPYRESRDEGDEAHQHPLQLDVIDRAVILWSNTDEVVFSPFMGVGSEIYGAVINGRRGIGTELKQSYYRQAVKNIDAAKNFRGDEQARMSFEHDEAEQPAEA